MGSWKTEWGCNRVGKESMGLPEKSLGSTFNGVVTGDSCLLTEMTIIMLNTNCHYFSLVQRYFINDCLDC